VKVARPDRPVVCVIGDGGFGYHLTEMSTAVKYGINVVTVLFNDRAFGNVARDMNENFGGSYEAELTNPDYMKLAESYGVEGIRVEDHSLLGDAVRRGIAASRPVLIEVPVETMPRPPFRSSRPAWAMPRE
jgi:acetolactate synthase-1/2/3 large subunit